MPKQNNWIKVHREIENNWLWKKKPFSPGQAWIDLIMKANYKEKDEFIDGKIITVKRGQLLTSIRSLGSRWGWSKDKVVRFLTILEVAQNISKNRYENQYTNRTLITIINYSFFQDKCDKSETETATPPRHHRDTTATPSSRNGDYEHVSESLRRKEGKKVRKKEKREREGETPSPPLRALPPFEKIFNLFKKENKDRADAEGFYDHYAMKGTKMADWPAAVRNWIRKEPEFKARESKNKKQAPGPNYQQQVFDGSRDEEFLKKLRETGGRL